MPLDPALTELTTVSQASPTVEFTDFVTRTGFVTFYAAKTTDLNVLTQSDFYSDTVTTSILNQNPTEFTKMLDLDFDIEFKETGDVRGTGTVNVPVMMVIHNSSKTHSSYVIVKVRHWDGSTETDLVTNQSDTWIETSTGTNEVHKAMFGIDVVIPERHFAEGDTLRLTVELWGDSTDSGGNGDWVLGHDPKNRGTTPRESLGGSGNATALDFGSEPTILLFKCPFKVE